MKNTKILATYGPAIADKSRLAAVVRDGVNVFRINCSHGTTDDFTRAAAAIRETVADERFPIGLLFDISGPKLRLSRFTGEIKLEKGTRITLTIDHTDLPNLLVKVNHPAIIESVEVGNRIFIDDGQYAFAVVETNGDRVILESETAGNLSGGKGINLPGVKLGIPTLTEKDREDIKTAVACDADYIALSFVRSPDDIREAQELIAADGGDQRVIAKLEKSEAIDSVDDIIRIADGVMIARGDLGVELPPEELPSLQNRIIRLSNKYQKPVIVATQMLESMRFSPRPTRAEVNDVASAVEDYVDAVMLSAETATGDFPVEAVQMMSRVIAATEKTIPPAEPVRQDRTVVQKIPQAIADAVAYTQEHRTAKVVFAFTTSGFTAQLISSLCSPYPIIALTTDPKVMSALSLYRSVYPVQIEQPASFSDLFEIIARVGHEYGVISEGDNVLVTGGAPFGQTVPTNFMLIMNPVDDKELGK